MFRVAAALALLCFASVAHAAPRVELYTMGAGEDLFSAFGHAAICVVEPGAADGRCYNYGTADFSTPLPLTWDFVRGRARFWVAVLSERGMLRYYREADRTVWRQVLALPDAEADALAQALAASTDERVKYYRYHHFADNCTTRIRDLIDRATGGALRRETTDRGVTFRQWARQGFVASWPLQMVTELFLGHPADHRTDSWEAMFLPSELREEVAARLHSPAQAIYTRRGPLPQGRTWYGRLAFVLGGLALALVIVLLRRSPRAAVIPAAVILGLLAVVLDALALLSTFPELVYNEAILAFWPTDLALPWLTGRWRRAYVTLRLGSLALVAVLHLGPLTQPLAPLALCLLPLLALRLTDSR